MPKIITTTHTTNEGDQGHAVKKINALWPIACGGGVNVVIDCVCISCVCLNVVWLIIRLSVYEWCRLTWILVGMELMLVQTSVHPPFYYTSHMAWKMNTLSVFQLTSYILTYWWYRSGLCMYKSIIPQTAFTILEPLTQGSLKMQKGLMINSIPDDVN